MPAPPLVPDGATGHLIGSPGGAPGARGLAIPRSDSNLLAEMAATAARVRLPVDRAAYEAAGRDPAVPIAWAGRFDARACILGRDLGRDEVREGEPLVGASGRAVRAGVLRALGAAPGADPLLRSALDHVLLCNLVPYKPPGNRVFSTVAREAFRPCLERLLCCLWKGEAVLALGNEARDWFRPYLLDDPGGDPYTREVPCRIEALCSGRRTERRFVLCPLPHPSPANARWRARFPALLAARLARWLPSTGGQRPHRRP